MKTSSGMNRGKRGSVVAIFAGLIVCVGGTIGIPTTAHANEASSSKHPASSSHRESIPHQFIVTVRSGKDPSRVAASARAQTRFIYRSALNGFSATLNDGQLNALRHHPDVAAIEPNQEISGDTTQSIGSSGQPWGIDRIDQRSRNLSRTFTYYVSGRYGAGNGVRAYVIDSGIATANSDFGGRAQNVVDYVGGNGQDCHGHGTHVAGTIGGARFGVAKSVLLRGVRVLNCANSGTIESVIAGVNWVRSNAVKPAVANISIGSPRSEAMNTAVYNLAQSGVFVAASAGNDGVDACTSSPASSAGAYTVAATDWYDNRSVASTWASNYGACVDAYAPGSYIQSAWLNSGTNTISGTSMAAPHVTGVAALLKSDYGDYDYKTLAGWINNASTEGVVSGNVSGTPNRLLHMYGW